MRFGRMHGFLLLALALLLLLVQAGISFWPSSAPPRKNPTEPPPTPGVMAIYRSYVPGIAAIVSAALGCALLIGNRSKEPRYLDSGDSLADRTPH